MAATPERGTERPRACAAAGFALVALGGCALQQIPYAEPRSGALATLTFENHSGNLTLDVAYFATSKGCVGRRHVGALTPHGTLTRTFPAGGDMTFQTFLADRFQARYCLENLRFAAAPGARYVFATTSAVDRCNFTLTDVSDASKQELVAVKKMSWNNAWDENGSYCDE